MKKMTSLSLLLHYSIFGQKKRGEKALALYSPRNDPDPEMIPNPEMIPKLTPK